MEIPMKLFYAPGACSMGIHILLEEIGKPYQVEHLNTREGQQHRSEFVAVNPKGKVPTLIRDDGSVLTEWPAIATYLARTNPEINFLPKEADAEARVFEAVDYIVGTIHMQAFNRLFRPGNFTPNEADYDAVTKTARDIAAKGFLVMDNALRGKEYLAGALSIADLALFYVEYWATAFFEMALPANCAAHFARMKARPAVQRILKAEGLT